MVRVGSMGRRPKVGGIIVPVSLLCKFASRPNFLVAQAEKFVLFALQKC
ncbi:MAG: hypothetical protein F6K22_33640 [Okeania sp. SIO2F4]|nr:hypothetical protein [Okeania sp. SIO2F4]